MTREYGRLKEWYTKLAHVEEYQMKELLKLTVGMKPKQKTSITDMVTGMLSLFLVTPLTFSSLFNKA